MMTANMRSGGTSLTCGAQRGSSADETVAIPLFPFLKNMLFPLFGDVGYDTDFDLTIMRSFWYDYGLDNMTKIY